MRGQTYHIVDCDDYTRNWYSEQQVEQAPGMRPPQDPYEIREAQERKKRKDYDMAKQRRVQAEMMHKEEVKHRYALDVYVCMYVYVRVYVVKILVYVDMYIYTYIFI